MTSLADVTTSGPARRGGHGARVAVLMPAYNDQAGLERSLQSLTHDGAEFDVVVVDDGSKSPIQIPPGLPFPVIRLRLAINGGISRALNAGLAQIAAADYAYVARLDCGDLSLPGRIAAQARFLDANPDHAVVGCWSEFIDLEGQILFVFRPPENDARLRRFQYYRSGFMHSAVMMRVSAVEAVGRYDERYNGAEDYDLFLSLADHHRIANLPAVYLKYEVDPNALSRRRFRQGIVRLRVQARHFKPFTLHAWLGFGRNALLLFVTRDLVIGLKRWAARLRGGRASQT